MSDHAHDHSHAHAHAHSHEHGHGDCCEVHDHDDEPIIEDVSDQISKQKLDNHTHSHANGSSSKPEPQQAVAALDALLSKPLPTPGRPMDPPKGQGADDRHGHGDDINGYSKTFVSQQLKGAQSYYYWHSDAERRRAAGEQPAPLPMPNKLASTTAVKEKKIRGIEKYTLMDDGDVVKVYIPLEGELAGVKKEQVEIEFTDRTLLATIATEEIIYRFHIERLSYLVLPDECKFLVNKAGKLLIKLKKKNHMDMWTKLRGV